MSKAENRFMQNITSLPAQIIPSVHKVVCWVIAFLVLVVAAGLYFTPWIQTAHGSGAIDSLDPVDRMQAISALVDGQIQTWHVREGMQVSAGDPIVTLIDVDAQRLEKLQSQLAATRLAHQANETAVANAESNLQRQQALQEQGLVSRKDVEAALIKVQELKAKAASSLADINQVSMVLSRQATMTKTAPVDGTILRLFNGGGSTFVKAGDVLAQFIPKNAERTVRVIISGLDAPLVKPGAKARLQFEGWPVFQFSGWPGTAVGTFGGGVTYVEPVADATGAFQVWIKPDESEMPWPEENIARLGSRVKAWILLEEVRLGYELWRQLNNFPPQKPATQASSSAPGW